MSTAAKTPPGLERVQEYYASCTRDYLRHYGTGKHLHMHYGLWQKNPRQLPPMKWMALRVCELAGAQAGMLAVDLGCGVGGTSLQAQQLLGVRPVLVNLFRPQLELAGEFSKQRVGFALPAVQADFHRTPFANETFGAAWNIESACHSHQKAELAKEVFRILKPGARWVVADVWRSNTPFRDGQHQAQWEAFLDGWAVPDFAQVDHFLEGALAAGFVLEENLDVTADVVPCSRKIEFWARFFFPFRRFLSQLGLVTRDSLAHSATLLEQGKFLREGLWEYRLVVLRKPV